MQDDMHISLRYKSVANQTMMVLRGDMDRTRLVLVQCIVPDFTALTSLHQ